MATISFEQLEGESNAEYEKFVIYRDLGINRSMRKAYQVYLEQQEGATKVGRELGKSSAEKEVKNLPGNWVRLSKLHHWSERADLFERNRSGLQDAQRQAELVEGYKFNTIQHLKKEMLETKQVAQEIQPVVQEDVRATKEMNTMSEYANAQNQATEALTTHYTKGIPTTMLREFEELTAKMNAANEDLKTALDGVKDTNLAEIAACKSEIAALNAQLAPLPTRAKELRLKGESRSAHEIINQIEDLNFELAKKQIELAELQLNRATTQKQVYTGKHQHLFNLGRSAEQICFDVKLQAEKDLQEAYRLYNVIPDHFTYLVEQYRGELKDAKQRLTAMAEGPEPAREPEVHVQHFISLS